MKNLSRGKIYMIYSDNGDMVYVGSTCSKYLSYRMATHASSYKCLLNGYKTSDLSSFRLFEKYGIDNCKIILLESFPCNSIDELHAREHHYIILKNAINKQKLNKYKITEIPIE